MLNFDFYNPTRILFGKGKVAEINQHVPADARVLVLMGGNSAKNNGTLAEVKAALGNRYVEEFSGIEPTRSMFQTDDMVEQHNILNIVARLVEQGLVTTTLKQTLSPINAENLRKAHAQLEAGNTIGKIVLSGWN